MSIQRFLDKNEFLVVRPGVQFYYFGTGCIADYYSNSIAYLDQDDVRFVKFCTGKYRVQEIIQKIGAELPDRIERLLQKGVIIIQNQPIEVELIFRGVKGAYYPKELVIELTNKCNFACPFCYKNAGPNGEFMEDQTILLLDRVIHGHVHHILLTGGEPTMHPSYLKYIDLFADYAKVYMISNGSFLYEHDAESLRKLEYIQFSLYGCSDEEYEKMTGVRDGFTRLCKSVAFAKKNGIPSILSVTLCDKTMDHMEAFIQTAIKLEMNLLRVGIADIFGRGKYLYADASKFQTEKNEALNQILELKRRYRRQIKLQLPNIGTDHMGDHEDLDVGVYRGALKCGCGSQYLAVSHKGEIRPCQQLPESWFSIKSKEALTEHIKGDFHHTQLSEGIFKYYEENHYKEQGIVPCYALEIYRKKGSAATNEQIPS